MHGRQKFIIGFDFCVICSLVRNTRALNTERALNINTVKTDRTVVKLFSYASSGVSMILKKVKVGNG